MLSSQAKMLISLILFKTLIRNNRDSASEEREALSPKIIDRVMKQEPRDKKISK